MRGQRGYTLIEVLLFLAISGGLLSIAFIGFRNKQVATQFSQGMQEIQAQIQATFSDAQNGQFNYDTNLTCDLSGPGGRPNVHSAAAQSLGGNQNCTYLGKVVGFGDAASPNNVNIYTVVGRQAGSQRTRDVLPTIATALTERKTLPWGIRVRNASPPAGKVYSNVIGSVNGLDDSRQLPALFTGTGFLQALPAQQAYIESGANYQAPPSGRFAIGRTPTGALSPTIICFDRSDGGQTAVIEVGPGNGQGLTVQLTFDRCE